MKVYAFTKDGSIAVEPDDWCVLVNKSEMGAFKINGSRFIYDDKGVLVWGSIYRKRELETFTRQALSKFLVVKPTSVGIITLYEV